MIYIITNNNKKYNMMKTNCRLNLTSILSMFLVVVFTTSCSKDDSQPIQLHRGIHNDKPNPVTDNQVAIVFPTSEKTQFVISGGDGHFAVTNSNEKTITVSTNDRSIEMTPLATGNSVVTITDQSGNLYTLNVKVYYREMNLIIKKQDVIVIGDKLSEVQKTEIRQQAALTLPVKVNGGFKMVYNINDEPKKGHVFIYKETYGVGGVESVFEEKRVEIDVNGVKEKHPVFAITIDGKQRDFYLVKYIAPKSDMMAPLALNEVLTDQFKAEYPDVEWVYTQQGFQTK